eukprot:gene8509-10094_t
MGRRAQMWKNQEQLTNLGIVNDRLTIEDQLRVKIALRVMRKAHTKTLRSEADRLRRKAGIVMPGEDHGGLGNFSSIQDDTVHIRSLDDIMVEARANFALTKDKRKEETVSTKYGQLRPIFPSLVEEIRMEQEEKQRRRDEQIENDLDFSMSLADGDSHLPSAMTGARRKNQTTNTQQSKRRPQSAVTVGRRPTSANRHRLNSHEAPGKLGSHDMGENRTRNLSKATLASVEALNNMTNMHSKRAELVPIKSSDVHALNAQVDTNTSTLTATNTSANSLHPPTSASKKGRDLHQHLHNAEEMQQTGKYHTHKPDEFKLKRAVSFVPDDDALDTSSVKPSTHNNQPATHSSRGTVVSVKPQNLPNINITTGTNGSAKKQQFVESNGSGKHKGSSAVSVTSSNETRSTSPSNKNRLFSPSGKSSNNGNSLYTNSSSGELDDFNGNMTTSMKAKGSMMRSSSFFSGSAVVGDERITRALAQRDEILRSKEDEIRARIRQKELQSFTKAEMMLYEQKQRAWMIAIISLSRFKILSDALVRKRQQTEIWDESKATKKAIGFIERWWRRGRVRMMFRRYPHLFVKLKKVVMPYMFRLRLRRKKRSADLIVTFLQDSTGMSETMRAIYAFRQTVIRLQRWIRKWISIQYCRMRILWIKCEKMFKAKAKQERINQAIEDKAGGAHHHAHVNYFSGTLSELSNRKKVLAKILEDQEHARQARQDEVKFQEEANIKKKAVEEERKRIYKANKLKKLSQKESAASLSTPTNGGNKNDPNNLNAASLDSAGTIQYLLKRSHTRREALPWEKKIRNSAVNIRIYDTIREVLKFERRRHMLNLVKYKKIGESRIVGAAELKRYLKNPYNYDGVDELSKKLSEVRVVVQSPAQIYRTPFLLLTQGGNEALERLLQNNKYMRF